MTEYAWLNEMSQQFLDDGYLLPGQTTPDRVRKVGDSAEEILGIPGISDRVVEAVSKGWFSLSTPIWTNFGTDRGLPISCFSSYISDDMESILWTQAEVGMMTKHGGGTSAYFGKLRGRGSDIRDNGKSAGSVNFMQLFQTSMEVISQGSTRRGNFAAYLDIDHPDVEEFLTIKSDGSKIQHIQFGVCVPDSFMEGMIAGDVDRRRIWAKVIDSRNKVGMPYIFFTDNVNNNTVDVYKDKQLKIYGSNLCTEILEPTSEDESFVCCLLSMNAAEYDEWKGTHAVDTAVCLLDAVTSEFARKARGIPFMDRAVKFAERHRALGIGVLGWHTLLQRRMIPYESMEAKYLNVELFQHLQAKSYEASARLADLLGEPELLKGYGRRHTTLMAVAPTKSSSFILGQVSQGIEPYRTNYDVHDRQKGKFTVKNPQLEALLESKGRNDRKTWDSIMKNFGGVQHLDFLTDLERDVFKTYAEISQREVIIQAAQRQKYIDQGQSLNLMIHPDVPVKDLNALLIDAWKMGIKTFYYQYSINAAQKLGGDLRSCRSCEA